MAPLLHFPSLVSSAALEERMHKLVTMLLVVAAIPAGAQGRKNPSRVPPGHLPPAGMCRIWIDGVPPGRQPAPTDCQTAVRTKPANARVIWGDQIPFPGKGKGKINKSDRDDDRTWDRNRDRDDDDRDHRYEDARRSGNWPATANGSKRSAKEIAAARKAEAKSLKNHGKGKGKGGH